MSGPKFCLFIHWCVWQFKRYWHCCYRANVLSPNRTARKGSLLTPPVFVAASRQRWIWALLALWLAYSVAVLAWHVLSDPVLFAVCRTR